MKKTVIAIIVGFIFVTAIYIALSTLFISKDMYREAAWDYVKHEDSIINWKNGSVQRVKLSSDQFIVNPNGNSKKVNRFLLNLNGKQAVKVTFKTKYDVLLGPTEIYINPFTRQVIGMNARY
jgi:uncharacterized protein YxeA